MVNTSGNSALGVFSIPLHVGSTSSSVRRRRERSSERAVGEFIGDGDSFLVPVAAEAVLCSACSFNPIVFHGPSGTGKTFLARGLVQRWREAHPVDVLVTTTGADFAREYANAVDTDSLPDFRQRLRSATLLLIDDLDILQTKLAAQHELVSTLDVLVAQDSQVLITLKQAPLETPGLRSPLASRLSAGLTVPLATPGPGARRVILEHLLARHDLELTASALELAVLNPFNSAQKTLPDFAALHQFVLRLVASRDRSTAVVEFAEVQQILAMQEPRGEVLLKSIAQQVSKYFHLRVSELRGPTRQQRVVRARGVAMLLARRLTGSSLEQVGRHFGNRDHTTVLHACRKTESLMDSDPAIHHAVHELTTQLASQ